MSGSLPARPSLTQLKKLVKELRRSHAEGDAEALERLRRFHPRFERSSDDALRSAALAQRSAQLIIAREHGFDSWQELRRHVEFLESGKFRRVYDPSAKQRDAERFQRLIRSCREGNLALAQRVLEESPALVNRTDGYLGPRCILPYAEDTRGSSVTYSTTAPIRHTTRRGGSSTPASTSRALVATTTSSGRSPLFRSAGRFRTEIRPSRTSMTCLPGVRSSRKTPPERGLEIPTGARRCTWRWSWANAT